MHAFLQQSRGLAQEMSRPNRYLIKFKEHFKDHINLISFPLQNNDSYLLNLDFNFDKLYPIAELSIFPPRYQLEAV